MSATLIIRKNEISWLPKSDLYEVVVNRIADQLQNIDTELAQIFYGSVEGSFILNLSMLNQQEFSSVFRATRAAQEKLLVEWAKHEIPHYQAYAICELKALLSLDKRSVSHVREVVGTLTIREGVVWHTESWAYKLLIEFLMTCLSPENDASLIQRLLLSRSNSGNPHCNLAALDETEFKAFIRPVDLIKKLFIDMRIRDGFAPEFETVFFPSAIPLYEAFRSDPRISKQQWPEE